MATCQVPVRKELWLQSLLSEGLAWWMEISWAPGSAIKALLLHRRTLPTCVKLEAQFRVQLDADEVTWHALTKQQPWYTGHLPPCAGSHAEYFIILTVILCMYCGHICVVCTHVHVSAHTYGSPESMPGISLDCTLP